MSKFKIYEILNFDACINKKEFRIAQIRNLRMPAHMPGCMRGEIGRCIDPSTILTRPTRRFARFELEQFLPLL